jgi:spermidine synthase
MLPPGCPRHALLLGLGGGTVATLLARRCPAIAIAGIERDPAVIATACRDFGLDALPQLTIERADAFAWMDASMGREGYDLICVDLFEGGRLALGTLTTRFLRQVAALLAPGGVATINLMVTGRTSEQIHRIERVFAVQRRLRTRGNLILHLTPGMAPDTADTAETPSEAP